MSLIGTKASRATKKKKVEHPGLEMQGDKMVGFSLTEGTVIADTEITTTALNVDTRKEEFEKMLSNPKMREMVLINARDIKEQMHGNWFTLDQLTKKSGIKSLQIALDFMNLICLFEMAYRKVSDKGIIKYKIALCNADLKSVILEDIQEKKDEIAYLEGRLEKLNSTN